MPMPEIVPRSGMIPQPQIRSALGRSLRSFADTVPNAETLAREQQEREQDIEELRGKFVSFVTDGALEVASILREKGVRGDYYTRKHEVTGKVLGTYAAYNLRSSLKYGGVSRSFNGHIESESRRSAHSGSAVNRLIILSKSGKLAIAKTRPELRMLDTSPFPRQWFTGSAITDEASYEILKSQAESDMEQMLVHYIGRA